MSRKLLRLHPKVTTSLYVVGGTKGHLHLFILLPLLRLARAEREYLVCITDELPSAVPSTRALREGAATLIDLLPLSLGGRGSPP